MESARRKAATAAYRETKRQGGIYAVRCAATGEARVGRSGDLAAQRNSLDFQLRHGPNNAAMRAAWAAHGAESFSFEALEAAPDALTPAGRADFLKRRALHWREVLRAAPI